MTLSIDDFDEFFAEVNGGRPPFGWQRRLADRLLDRGVWPDQIAVPTGAGKTSAIDVHVFAVATALDDESERPPRRLAMVINRRALVDSQYERARALNGLLVAARGGVVAEVAERLRALRPRVDGSDPPDPILVARLRGGEPPSAAWRDEPGACAVICATPDMWGSRLLMRGYGTSRYARPVEAGLLAVDAAVVIDEAHLNRQLLDTARRVAKLESWRSGPIGTRTLQAVETTATPSGTAQSVVGVTADDLAADPTLNLRLATPKPIRLRSVPAWPDLKAAKGGGPVVTALIEESERLRGTFGPTVGCFVNTVARAVVVAGALRARDLTVALVCGRLRPDDLRVLRERHPGLLSIEGNPSVDVLVATQTLEVGADLDLSAAITELAAASALAQRAGRVNRLGQRADTEIVVVAPDGPVPHIERYPYGTEDLEAARQWVIRRANDQSGLAPWSLRQDVPPTSEGRLRHRLEPWDAWHLSRTSDRLAAEPDLAVWLSDSLDPDLDCGLVVRDGLTGDAALDIPALRAFGVGEAEVFPTRLADARTIVEKLSAEPCYLFDADEVQAADDRRVKPGATLIVPSNVDLFRAGIVSPDDGDSSADDVADLASSRLSLRVGPGLPSSRAVGAQLADEVFALVRDQDVDTRIGRDALARVLLDASSGGRERWASRLRDLGRALQAPLATFEVNRVLGDSGDDEPALRQVVIVDRRRRLPDDAIQVLAPRGEPVALSDHRRSVGARARLIADAVALPEPFAEGVELAGLFHDDGKRDARFQVRLGHREGDPLLAKSGMASRRQADEANARSGLEPGWRHEQLSAAIAWRDLRDRDPALRALATLLAGTSHGRGRHGAPAPAGDLVGADHPDLDAASVLFDDGQWEELMDHAIVEWGPWGVAYLEAIVRAADVQVSREGG